MLTAIHSDIKRLFGQDSEKIEGEAYSIAGRVWLLGFEAANLAREGAAKDDPKVANLYSEATRIKDWCGAYVQHCYTSCDVPQPNPNPETNTAQKQEKKEQQGEDFLNEIMNNSANSSKNQDRTDPSLPTGSNQSGKNAADGMCFPVSWKHEFPKNGDLPNSFSGLMYFYCDVGLWEKGKSREDKMRQIKDKLHAVCLDAQKIDENIEKADAWLELARPIHDKGIKRDTDTPEQEKEIAKLGGPLLKSIKKKRTKKANQKEKQTSMRSHSVNIASVELSQKQSNKLSFSAKEKTRPLLPPSGHPNEITTLPPANTWHLYVDESGSDERNDFDTGGGGIIAGVLTTPENPLPKCFGLHASTDATEEKIAAADKAIENMIHHKQCGVLALPVGAFSSSAGWSAMIGTMIDLVLRMLPLPNENKKVRLVVYVENKGAYAKSDSLIYLRDACMYNLMHTFPDRANRIQLEVEIMDKKCPYDSYPDIVANTCFARKSKKNPVAPERFRASRWDKTCFINYPADDLKNIWDCYYRGQSIPAELWNDIVLATNGSETGLLGSMQKTIGAEAKNNVELWKSYLNFTMAHLVSKAINLWVLRHQIDWLETYAPGNEVLPPRVRLLWLTARLAEANHVGEVGQQDSPELIEFRSLMAQLYEEDAPLVCAAVLHLAVNETNAFRFESAKKLVTDFSDIGSLLSKEPPFTKFIRNAVRKLIGPDTPNNYVPAAIPGLRYYGQLLSSCGQHEAFLGSNDVAMVYFKEAINCFERLSENKLGDISQTRAYLVTALTDIDPNFMETVSELRQYLNDMPDQMLPSISIENKDCFEAQKQYIVNAIPYLAADDQPCRKYHHHILLRYIVASTDPNYAAAYLACESNWKHETGGHPWEFIEFYRGMLFQDTAKRLEYFRRGYDIAKDGGATLRIIAAVILGSIYCYDKSVKDELTQLIQTVIGELPAIGDVRRAALRDQLTAPVEPLALAKAVLPFNFR